MRLHSVLEGPLEALKYAERYVNDGSPSGFSGTHTTSAETSPFGSASTFKLFSICGGVTREFGQSPQSMSFISSDTVLVHPDVARRSFPDLASRTAITATPTASARTVHLEDVESTHLKLHYDGVLGRLDRRLGAKEAAYAVHVTSEMLASMSRAHPNCRFDILPEGYARVMTLEAGGMTHEVGMVHRSLVPSGQSIQPTALVPAFSLFSKDRLDGSAGPLLIQMLAASGEEASSFVLERLVFPLLDAYFFFLIEAGLQIELHAQNAVIGLCERGLPSVILIRDMESVDTDISLQQDLLLQRNEPPSTHKCIQRSDWNYQIKHSFMFDHKLGEYLIAPILTCCEHAGLLVPKALDAIIRQHVAKYLAVLPRDFFPSDGSYSFDRVQIDRQSKHRPYVRSDEIRFRGA